MSHLNLFIDASVNSKTKEGFGAYLFITDLVFRKKKLNNDININQFENTTSTKLEIQNLIGALKHVPTTAQKINIYTDSQNIITLPQRREKLELNNYYSKNNKLLSNHDLYKEFFILSDLFKIELIKVKGHKPKSKKNTIDEIFTLVDKASRKSSRNTQLIDSMNLD
ncbi:MAG: hypothetical protein JEZ09_21365 [Salinivirgaceae bacterium]|nr:hypothetical protein [Salinivirgaceae bacterium]